MLDSDLRIKLNIFQFIGFIKRLAILLFSDNYNTKFEINRLKKLKYLKEIFGILIFNIAR